MTHEQLKARRKALGLTQTELADLLGVGSLAVWRWENEKRSIPPYLHLALDALEVEGNQ